MLLRRVAMNLTSLLSWHKSYDFNAANFRRHIQWKCALQTYWIRILIHFYIIGNEILHLQQFYAVMIFFKLIHYKY